MKKIVFLACISLLSFYVFTKYAHIKNVAEAKAISEAFIEIYDKDLWGNGSGPGSTPENAEPYLKLLQTYLDSSDIHSIFDLGCGDWRLMSTLSIPASKMYSGFDLVPTVIDANTKKYQTHNVTFHLMHALQDFQIQHGDLLIVKDVMQHWPTSQIQYFLKNIVPNFKYVLITNDFDTTHNNTDIKPGHCRCIDLIAPPFNVNNDFKFIADYEAHGVTKRIYLYTNPANFVKTQE